MTAINKPLVAAFADGLSRHCYKKKSDTWYCEKDETILLVNLQRSDYGRQYYINLAIWIKALGVEKFPKEHVSHIRIRLGQLLTDHEQRELAIFLDLENDLPETERRRGLTRMIEQYALPFLESCSSLSEIRRLLDNDMLKKAWVIRRVYEFFDLSIPDGHG